MEEALLIPDWVEGVADDAGAEDFLAEGDNDEGVLVPPKRITIKKSIVSDD